MSLQELRECREKTHVQWQENAKAYDVRYGSSPAEYGSSISDDYNGDAEEFARLTKLLTEIDEEIRHRSDPTR